MTASGTFSADQRPPVVVLLGGPSAEHDVSLVSGRAVATSLTARGWVVEAWLIDLDGDWWQLPPTAWQAERPGTAYDTPGGLGASGPHSAMEALEALAGRDPAPVVWIALHGPFGEDGTVQALCEAAGLVYTGSGVGPSAVGMDKSLFKRLMVGLEIPVVPFETLTAAEFRAAPEAAARRLAAFAARLPDSRLMIKPACLGSSVGMSIVHRPDEPPELEKALSEALRFDDVALAEAYLLRPREFEVAVLGNSRQDAAVYGPGEVLPGHEFYDYAAKYEPGVSRTLVAPELSGALRTNLRELALATFLAIGASGFARVDFLVSNGRVFLSEINTIPGLTPISLFPMLCAAEGGLDFGTLAERIIELAVGRAAGRPSGHLARRDLP